MKKLDVYIIRKYYTTFLLSISLLILVVIVFDISEQIDNFYSGHVTLKQIIFDYYLNFIPYFLNLFLYLFVFISVSYGRFLVPYISSAVILMLAAMWLSNFVIPKTNIKLNEFDKTYIHNSSRHTFGRNIHVQIASGSYAYVRTFDSKKGLGADFTLEDISISDGMSYKLSAKEIKYDYDNEVWHLSDYVSRKVLDDREIVTTGASMDTVLNLKPSDFVFASYDIKTMNFFELRDFIAEEKIKGVHPFQNKQ